MRLRSQSYLDFNAGAPLHNSVMGCLAKFSSLTGNPSSVHSYGQELSKHVRKAKQQILKSLSQGSRTNEEEIVFSGSGTEATQWVWNAIQLSSQCQDELTWVCSEIEHKATLDTANRFAKCGYEVVKLPVHEDGSLKDFKPKPKHVYSFHWINNELGVIWPVEEYIKKIKAEKDTWVHIDACQAWGKEPNDLTRIDADFITFSAHKIGGLPGLGITWINPKIANKVTQPKTGTLNVFGILACAEASKHIASRDELAQLFRLQSTFEEKLKSMIPGIKINGETVPRVCNTTHFTITGIKNNLDLVMYMDVAGFAVSAGSACSSGIIEASHVVNALGYPKQDGIHSLRVSYGLTTTADELDGFVAELAKVVTPK
ncbi:MAG: aminotransferase class V-fold PLP-dependent enzyme [Xanthomonadaceae bacterium]|nr:aminotransferase class V-fold PLP-dependent enzyme [Xanthomonadaceae bacterium]